MPKAIRMPGLRGDGGRDRAAHGRAALFITGWLAIACLVLSAAAARAWSPKQAPLMTRWASQVNPARPWPEYPRPQMVRADWLNLNGIWEYQPGSADDGVPANHRLSSEILVPYPVESALSGVMEHHDRLWYRRHFTVPAAWKGRRVALNFGAVDFESEVYVNGVSVGVHRGGYLPFSYDITPYLKGAGPQELIVRVFDPTDAGGEPRGKQTTRPGGIMYTPTTGIWQSVWLEPLPAVAIRDLKIVPDIDARLVHVAVNVDAPAADVTTVVTVRSGRTVIAKATGQPGDLLSIPIANPRLWSPDHPFLYDLDVALIMRSAQIDRVRSYFGMRKISIGEDHGVRKMFLNNRFVFEIGPLDQGFWPDGIYTQPTEAALKADIQAMKTLGFNMVRKHIKVEPARWYYWTDHLGLMVWQDMPSPDSYLPGNETPPPVDKPEFEKELLELVRTRINSPSIIMWDLFNEGQGQFDTPRLVREVKELDPSRLVNEASGGGYSGSGDVFDIHSYPAPRAPDPRPSQALACGEYGGIGLFVPGHTWAKSGGGYTNVKDGAGLEDLYSEFSAQLKTFRDERGLSAAVYTQITDVETELNGLLTYDRTFKCDPAVIAKANHFRYVAPHYRAVVPTSEKASQTWRYTLTPPPPGWTSKTFDDLSWQQGPGGFGTDPPGRGILGTRWSSGDIWLRRVFSPGPLTPSEVSRLVLRDYHDEDIEVYINGAPAYSAPGFITSYEYRPISAAARRSLNPDGQNVMAVHCHQTTGGQYIDVGIFERVPNR